MRRRLSRDTWLALALFGLLAILTSLAAIWGAAEERELPRLAAHSAQREGARALRLWLDELGYKVDEVSFSEAVAPAENDLILMLEPVGNISDAEWQEIDSWIDDGSTLVLAGTGFGTLLALEHFDVRLRDLSQDRAGELQVAERLESPPLPPLSRTRPSFYFESDRADAVPLLTIAGKPVMLTWPQGDGRIVLSALPYPLTNEGLKEAGNAELALNLISLAPAGGRIWFDEWHHGVRNTPVPTGPGAWLRTSAGGQALLFTGAVLFIALLLRSRRFGRPVPLPEHGQKRTPIEHVAALAGMSRRAGHRRSVLEYHHTRLRRDIGRRYRLDPTLPEKSLVSELATIAPDLDTTTLNQLFARLTVSDTTDGELLHLARDLHDWLADWV